MAQVSTWTIHCVSLTPILKIGYDFRVKIIDTDIDVVMEFGSGDTRIELLHPVANRSAGC